MAVWCTTAQHADVTRMDSKAACQRLLMHASHGRTPGCAAQPRPPRPLRPPAAAEPENRQGERADAQRGQLLLHVPGQQAGGSNGNEQLSSSSSSAAAAAAPKVPHGGVRRRLVPHPAALSVLCCTTLALPLQTRPCRTAACSRRRWSTAPTSTCKSRCAFARFTHLPASYLCFQITVRVWGGSS